MGKVIIIFLLSTIGFLSIDAAILTCNFTIQAPTCIPQSFTPVTSADETITIEGKTSTFTDPSTYSLGFSSPSILNYVPTKMFKYFPNLQSVAFSSVELSNLVSNAFQDCGMLTSINMDNNNFPSVPASFASTCVNVTSLQMSNNHIQTIDKDAFQGMKYLQWMYLSQNEISCIPPGLFRHTPVIQMIDFMMNKVTALDPETFTGLPSLYQIGFHGNQISFLPAFNVKNTGLTMGLNFMFNENPITAIDPDMIKGVFTSRNSYMSMTNINMYNSNESIATCIPRNSMYGGMIYSSNWPTVDISLDTCYNNWTPEMENYQVPCGSYEVTTTTTTATSTTTDGSGGSGGNGGESEEVPPGPWKHKNFFAIISNAMRNFTANVMFT